MPDFESHDGTRLHYDVVGDATLPPVIAVAGGPARHPDYLRKLPGVTDSRALILLHQRGVGDSAASPTAASATWPELAEDVEALRHHLGLDRIDLLGHSAGTRVALSYAARYPEALTTLCLITPPGTWLVDAPDDTQQIIGRKSAEPWFADFQAAAKEYFATTDLAERARIQPRVAPIGWAHWTDTAKQHEVRKGSFLDAQARFDAGVSVDAADFRDRLAAVSCPVLVIAASEDGLTGVGPALGVAALFSNGRAEVVPDAGHYPWVENPVAVAEALDEIYPVR